MTNGTKKTTLGQKNWQTGQKKKHEPKPGMVGEGCGPASRWAPKGGNPNLEKVGSRRMGAPKGGGPEGWGAPKGGGPRRVGGPEGWGAPKGGASKGGAPKGGAPKSICRVVIWTPPPPLPKNVSLRGPALTKMREEGGEGPPPKKMSVWGGAGVDLPECQERRRGKHKSTLKGAGLTFPNVKNDAGKHKSTKKSVFFSETPPTPRTALPQGRPSRGPPFPQDRPSRDRPKFHSFCALSRRKIRSFLPSLGVFSLNFGCVFERRNRAHLGSQVVMWNPGGPTRPGHRDSHTTTRELQTALPGGYARSTKRQKQVHFAALMDICHLKNDELEPQLHIGTRKSRIPWWPCKRRLWSLCSFQWTGLVCVLNDCRRSNGCYCKITRLWRTSNWRRVCLYPSVIGGRSQIAQHYQKSQNVPMYGYVFHDTWPKSCHWRPRDTSWTKFFRTPISRIVMGRTSWGSSIGAWLGKITTLAMSVCSKKKGSCGRNWWKTLILTNQLHFLITKIWDVLNVNANRRKLLLKKIQIYLNHSFLLEQLKTYQGGRSLTQKQ